VLAGCEHKHRGRSCADEVADVDDPPIAQQPPERESTLRPCHDDQVVAGEELGARDDHKDQSKREHQSGQQPRDTERKCPGGARGRRRGKRGAKADESAGQDREHERPDRVELRLRGPEPGRPRRDLRRHQRIETTARAEPVRAARPWMLQRSLETTPGRSAVRPGAG